MKVINIYKNGDGNNSPRLSNISEVFIALYGAINDSNQNQNDSQKNENSLIRFCTRKKQN